VLCSIDRHCSLSRIIRRSCNVHGTYKHLHSDVKETYLGFVTRTGQLRNLVDYSVSCFQNSVCSCTIPTVTSFFDEWSIYYECCAVISLVGLGLPESQPLLAHMHWVSCCSRQMEQASIGWLLFSTRYAHHWLQSPVIYAPKREPWTCNTSFNEAMSSFRSDIQNIMVFV
jgi:hypothetical protein